MLLLERSSETGLSRNISNNVFGVRILEIKNLGTSSFLSKYISKMEKKNQKIFFVSEIIASKLVH